MVDEPRKSWREFVGFVLFTIAASIVYSILHDLVTASVSPAYFQPPYHPEVIVSTASVMLAVTWGIIATWWAGAIFGTLIAGANSFGPDPAVEWRRLRRRLSVALAVIWILAMAILAMSYLLDRRANPVGKPADSALNAVATTHLWSYAATAVWSLVIVASTWRRRRWTAS